MEPLRAQAGCIDLEASDPLQGKAGTQKRVEDVYIYIVYNDLMIFNILY